MRVAWLPAIALLFASCGGSDAPVPSPRSSPAAPAIARKPENRSPILNALEIQPSHPRSDQVLSISVKAHDPDHDPLRIEAAWYRNGVRHRRGENLSLSASDITRGDEIYAIVHVSDGKVTVSDQTPTVRVRNQVPRINSVAILPKDATAKDELLAVPKAVDSDNDTIEFSYRWSVNGKTLQNASSAQLEAGRVRRGDEVIVFVTGSDSEGEGDPLGSVPLRIGNSAPRITSQPTYNLSGRNEYQYQVAAVDPDGDRPLRFELVEYPPGMTVGLVSGLVSWSVPDDADGKYPVEVSVRDPHGAESRQSYVLELRWSMPPANTP